MGPKHSSGKTLPLQTQKQQVRCSSVAAGTKEAASLVTCQSLVSIGNLQIPPGCLSRVHRSKENQSCTKKEEEKAN